MSSFTKSLMGTVVLTAAATAVAVSADGITGSRLQGDFGDNHVQKSIDHNPGSGALGRGGFWSGAGRDTAGDTGRSAGREGSAVWRGDQDRYIDALGFYLEGMSDSADLARSGRTDSPFALNEVQRPSGNDAGKYVTVIGVKPRLNANFNLDRSTSEGWGISGKVVGTLPEPGTLLLMGLGLLGLGLARRRSASRAS